MFSSRRSALVIVIACLVAALGASALAQTDARVTELMDRMAAGLNGGHPMHMVLDVQVLVNGAPQPQQPVQELWARDMEHFRAEVGGGTVVTFTPEGVKVYVGSANVMLHIPAETLKQLGKDRAKALQAVGIGEPQPMVQAMLDSRDSLSIVNEDAIGGEECWLLAVSPDAYPTWKDAFPGLPKESVVQGVEIALGKESGAFRMLHIQTINPVGIEIYVTVTELEQIEEVTDEMLTYEPPADATIIEWTADKTTDQVAKEFQAAVQPGGGR